jgi:hypothetical protein
MFACIAESDLILAGRHGLIFRLKPVFRLTASNMLDRGQCGRYDALMGASRKSDTTADVPTQVFQKFLETVAAASGNAEMVSRLKTTLLEKHDFSEEALESAIFGESSGDD